MKRRILSAALTSSPAGWTAGLRGRDGIEPAPAKASASRTDLSSLEFPSDRVPSLLSQIERLRLQLSQSSSRLRTMQVEMVATLAAAAEAKDPPGQRHSMQVAFLVRRLASSFRLSAGRVEVIRTAAVLHDIGKIGIPDAILAKPGPLTADEYSIVKQHPVTGATILRTAPWLQREVPLVLHHHEWYDGGGYPDGLKGEEIPFGARMLHAADAIDAMLSSRSYKQPYSVERVCRELLDGRGKQFDPVIAETAANWLDGHTDELSNQTCVQRAACAEPCR
jgi:putative nucleotidyltransferase with HDIG domain